jgi:hypothetical protein
MSRLIGMLWAVACAVSYGAGAQKPPSNDELRSMYCVSVLRAEIGLQQRMIAAADEAAGNASTAEVRLQWNNTSAELHTGLSRLEGVLSRLQAYMLPRIGGLDPYALREAIRQGDDEFLLAHATAERCAIQCGPGRVPNDEMSACNAACSDPALLARVSACDDPPWLPR